MAKVKLTPTQAQEVSEAFFLFDMDGDGKVDATETAMIMRAIGMNPSEAEIADISKRVDRLTRSQIEPFMEEQLAKPQESLEEIADAFSIFDKDGSGYIDVHELKLAVTTMGERLKDEEIDEPIRQIDKDGEGKIKTHDIVGVLCQTAQQKM